MRLSVFLVYLLLATLSHAQSPSKILRYANSSTPFGENLPTGMILVNVGAGKTYLTLGPLTSDKSIASCSPTEIREISGQWTSTNTNLYYNSGAVTIGSSTPSSSAALEINSTSRGLLPPRMTQAQRDLIPSPIEGLLVYNTITQKINIFDGIVWRDFEGNSVQDVVVPTLTSYAVSAVNPPTATSGGTISSNGGDPITARGVCWGTSTSPTTALTTKTSDGTGIGTFTSSLTGLSTGITYYLRAYATNSAGTAYGPEVSFIAVANPTVTTTAITGVGSAVASSGGNVTSDGGAAVTVRGVCWSTSTAPTVLLSTKTTDGTGSGSFVSSITGLTALTTYHVRAYATNSGGTSYGTEYDLTTSAATLPVLTTTAASSLTTTTASSGGTVTNAGGAPITARGVVWSTSAAPTTALSTKTSDGSGTGTFTSSITGLYAGTAYNYRAYATNSAGTAYGDEKSLTTSPPVLPTLTTNSASSIMSTTATSGGNITNSGGGTITSRGVCWSTSSGPTEGGSSKTIDGSGTGAFTSYMTGLTGATQYYVRAYAKTADMTGYGNEITFTTAINVGQSYRGGIVAYILQPGDPGYIAGQTHGLIAAPTDQSQSVVWSNGTNFYTGASGTAIGTGNSNTNIIVTKQGTGTYAAKLCYDLVLGGYNDWFMPSIDEMYAVWLNRYSLSGWKDWCCDNDYMSSSDYNATDYWKIYWANGSKTTGNYQKSRAQCVRCIRAF